MEINKIKNKIKSIFKKEEEKEELPYERGIVTYSKSSIEQGCENDTTKVLIHYRGNSVYKRYPYSDILREFIEKVQRVPVFDFTEKPIKFPEGEEINPNELTWLE